MKNISWIGIYPALLTPFTENDEIDYPLFQINLDAQIEAGVDGIIIGGSLGEASTITAEEKREFLKYCVKTLEGKKTPVIINVAEQSTKVAIAMALEAEELGADGIMLLPPLKYKADDDEVVTYFKAVAAATKLPILIYNNPVDYGIRVTLAMFEELLPYANVQAVKESTRDLANITNMLNKFGDRFKILGGVDTISLESLMLGSHGLVAGLVDAFPRETVAMYKLVKAKRYDEAVAIYRWFMPLLELDIHPKLVQYIKLAATAEGIGSEHVRAPRLPLKGAERERVLKIINDAIANRVALPDYKNL
ncbi:dihydrodipicolinate synthase family protein [Pedobacter changchengzhani]|uniref:Dihydrodipicolinate synthase family protein n=1 Tax=Pedobacter changchengzhani TaxID=2529274 RepID=A0A4R5MPE2_9SPHI|nr:dihydrodipicolinate synthase family protein [Pedobacter changchengzhani]TDG37029.1 dihydrodipicolinate synthase family protein [Pedobacter changchengzhani]